MLQSVQFTYWLRRAHADGRTDGELFGPEYGDGESSQDSDDEDGNSEDSGSDDDDVNDGTGYRGGGDIVGGDSTDDVKLPHVVPSPESSSAQQRGGWSSGSGCGDTPKSESNRNGPVHCMTHAHKKRRTASSENCFGDNTAQFMENGIRQGEMHPCSRVLQNTIVVPSVSNPPPCCSAPRDTLGSAVVGASKGSNKAVECMMKPANVPEHSTKSFEELRELVYYQLGCPKYGESLKSEAGGQAETSHGSAQAHSSESCSGEGSLHVLVMGDLEDGMNEPVQWESSSMRCPGKRSASQSAQETVRNTKRIKAEADPARSRSGSNTRVSTSANPSSPGWSRQGIASSAQMSVPQELRSGMAAHRSPSGRRQVAFFNLD